MFGRAAHHDLVGFARHPQFGIIGKVFPQGHIFVQRGPRLIKHRDIQIGPEFHRPFIRLYLPQQHLDQRGLAHTVGPDKGDPVTALHRQIKVFHDGFAVKGFGQAKGLDHFFARRTAPVKGHRRRPLARDLGGALGAQFLQGAHTALIALAAGRNAFHRPTRLGLDLAVQLVALLVFVFPDFVAPCFEMLKPFFGPAHLPAVDPQGGPRQRAQECTVVADQNETRTGRFQLVLEPCNRFDIQMVGRLIQQHQFRRFRHQFCQCRPPAFATGCGVHIACGIKFQAFCDHIDLIGLINIKPAGGIITQSGETGHRRVLLHIAHLHAGGRDTGAAVRQNQPRHDLHQGRFARSIAPDQRHTVTGLDDQGQVFEYRIAAEGQRDIRELE